MTHDVLLVLACWAAGLAGGWLLGWAVGRAERRRNRPAEFDPTSMGG